MTCPDFTSSGRAHVATAYFVATLAAVVKRGYTRDMRLAKRISYIFSHVGHRFAWSAKMWWSWKGTLGISAVVATGAHLAIGLFFWGQVISSWPHLEGQHEVSPMGEQWVYLVTAFGPAVIIGMLVFVVLFVLAPSQMWGELRSAVEQMKSPLVIEFDDLRHCQRNPIGDSKKHWFNLYRVEVRTLRSETEKKVRVRLKDARLIGGRNLTADNRKETQSVLRRLLGVPLKLKHDRHNVQEFDLHPNDPQEIDVIQERFGSTHFFEVRHAVAHRPPHSAVIAARYRLVISVSAENCPAVERAFIASVGRDKRRHLRFKPDGECYTAGTD